MGCTRQPYGLAELLGGGHNTTSTSTREAHDGGHDSGSSVDKAPTLQKHQARVLDSIELSSDVSSQCKKGADGRGTMAPSTWQRL
jgi:hypothetical protein